MAQSEKIGDLAAALAKAQAAMGPAKKDKTNPHFKSRFASLESIWDAVRAPLTSNGLAVVQTVGGEGAALKVKTILVHSSGEWIDSEFAVVLGGGNPQAIGSAISYGRRYTLAAITGIVADEDDDGEAAEERGSPSRPAASKPPNGKATEAAKRQVQETLEKARTAGTLVIPFGRLKGVPINDEAKVSTEQLDWLRQKFADDSEDPEQARFKEKTLQQLAAVEAEIKRRATKDEWGLGAEQGA